MAKTSKCKCGLSFANKGALNRHKSECTRVSASSAETFRVISSRPDEEPPLKKSRRSVLPPWALPAQLTSAGLRSEASQVNSLSRAGVGTTTDVENGHQDQEPLPPDLPGATHFEGGYPAEQEAEDSIPPPPQTRSGRRIRPTWKLREVLPEDVGAVIEEPGEVLRNEPPTPGPSEEAHVRQHPRLVLLVTDYVRTVANSFGLRRFYKRRPHRPPQANLILEACYAPTADTFYAKKKARRKVADIIFPFPNLSSWRFSWHYTSGYKKTQADRDAMKALLTQPDFVPADIAATDFRKLDEQLASGMQNEAPWSDDREGWRTSSVTIGIPTGKRSTQASRREAAATARRVNRHEPESDIPPAHAIPGHHFTVPDFHHKSLCAEIVKTFSTDPAARDFVYDPFLVEHQEPDSPGAQRVHGELFNSPAWVQEDVRLHNSPPEPGCDLPRAIAAIMLWSDATVVSQFGNQKVWPAYMYFGNQSKYARARPTARAAHHVAYFTTNGGKSASAQLITHCRRELFHAQWECLLDEEFVYAYEHGIIIDCMDGIRRRIYPRIFTYSADYPEKMLIATLRDKGRCPCPHCLVMFNTVHEVGTSGDRDGRCLNTRETIIQQDERVQEARKIIYNDGYVVNSDRVEELLREHSLVPVKNTFSRLERFGFNIQDALVVDQLHEFELGVWKALFTHLVRILETQGPDIVNELNKRFRDVPAFAWTTIRKFADNVCEMKKMAARDFEDILQCIIPCFEGLLPEADNDSILTLLFVSAYWHALAKMRMHTDTSLQILDDSTSLLGNELRHFAAVTCTKFDTRETQAEYDLRKRAEARRASNQAGPSNSAAQPSSSTAQQSYYAWCIKRTGTTDSYTTQMGEHEHRRVKARWRRTNGVRGGAQVVNIDARESRMHDMAYELSDLGLDIPSLPVQRVSSGPEPSPIPAGQHHHIGNTVKNFVDLRQWQVENPGDPVVEDSFHPLRDEDVPIALHHDRIYAHATAHFNYTTYDLQRDQDIVHPSMSKADVLIHTPPSAESIDSELYPWEYARVLGIYHCNVLLPGRIASHRVDFLFVRWLERDNIWESGAQARRLERIHFTPWADEVNISERGFGFVNPSHVVRACHLIPAFHHGRTSEYLPLRTLYQDTGGDWKFFYVNRFADRDTFVRHLGCGVGHLGLRSTTVATNPRDSGLKRSLRRG
ncbi:hypothetical protein C8Q78DRAFT_1140637 [Trametes maxima]|nr:hypothetical protein C8Q78DRAFT_1140637 [Trametes maxima]